MAIRIKKHRKKGGKMNVFKKSWDRNWKHNRTCKRNFETEEKCDLVSAGER